MTGFARAARLFLLAGLILLAGVVHDARAEQVVRPDRSIADDSDDRNLVAAVRRTAAMPLDETESAGPTARRTAQKQWWPLTLLAAYSVLIVLASLGGGWLPALIHLSHMRMQLMLSLVGGLMLGIGLFHMLPHAALHLDIDRAVWWTMAGLLTMFLLIRTFHFHQHSSIELPQTSGEVIRPAEETHDHDSVVRGSPDPAQSPTAGLPVGHGDLRSRPEARSGDHAQTGHDHDDSSSSAPETSEPPGHSTAPGESVRAHRLHWVGIALGLSLHTLIDGVAVAASVKVDAGHEATWHLLGLGTFLAVLLHKPLDAVSITSLMILGGWSRAWQGAVNLGFALMCPLGAFAFVFGLEQFTGHQEIIVGCALAFAAGVFLCISLGDLLPEMEFHSHNRVPLSIALITGIALAWAIRYLEPSHLH